MDNSGLNDWVKFLTQSVDKKPMKSSTKICNSSVAQDIEEWKKKMQDKEKDKESV